MVDKQPRKSKRGFASMSREQVQLIATKGGRSVPDEKRAFSRNRELAAVAGRKGGSTKTGLKQENTPEANA